jgi:hypothetical protein
MSINRWGLRKWPANSPNGRAARPCPLPSVVMAMALASVEPGGANDTDFRLALGLQLASRATPRRTPGWAGGSGFRAKRRARLHHPPALACHCHSADMRPARLTCVCCRDASTPGCYRSFGPRTMKRAQGMPGEGLTHGPPADKKQAAVTTGSAAHPAFPARWVYGCFVISLVRRACWPPSLARRVSVVATLIPASGYQDHTT